MSFGTPVPLLLGIVLIICAVALFFIDKLKPGYERDSDKVYAILLLISGIFLLTHWNMELIPSFQQMIMAGMLATLLIENIRNRSPHSVSARQAESVPPPRPDPYRPSRSRPSYEEPPLRANVQAELEDDLIAEDQFSRARRIRGDRDSRSESRPSYRPETYPEPYLEPMDEPRPSRRRRPSPSLYEEESYSEPRGRRRRPLQIQGDVLEARPASDVYSPPSAAGAGYSDSGYADLGRSDVAEAGGATPRQRRRNGTSAFDLISSDPGFTINADSPSDPTSTEIRRRRSRRSHSDGEYVDFEPLESPYPSSRSASGRNGGAETDNSSHFDDDPELV